MHSFLNSWKSVSLTVERASVEALTAIIVRVQHGEHRPAEGQNTITKSAGACCGDVRDSSIIILTLHVPLFQIKSPVATLLATSTAFFL